MRVLDQTGDINGQQLYRLSRLYPLPSFVKAASSTDIYGEDELPNHLYADPTYRRFPCHTGPATYVSALFFLDKQAELEPETAKFIDARLDDFAFYHGISDQVTQLRKKLAASGPKDNISSLSDEDFALILEANESASGTRERHYPLRNALEVKRAAEVLKDNAAIIPYIYRQRAAERILTKAAAYGAYLGDLEEYVQKQAGHGAASAFDVATFIFNRAKLLKSARHLSYAIKLGEIARTVAANPAIAHNQDQLVKLAGLIDQVDRETGLANLLEDLPKPEEAFFQITEKRASQLRNEHLSTTSGNIYKMADLTDLKLQNIRSLMGSDFAEAVSAGGLYVSPEKLAEIVPTLPRGDAELFDRLLLSSGISPIAKEAAHVRGGFDDAELQILAGLVRPN